MKKFKFKLSGLLKMRKFKEDKVKIELGKIVTKMTQIKDRISELNKDIVEGYVSQEAVARNTTGKLMQFYPLYIESKREHIAHNYKLLEELQKEYDEKVIEMKVAMGEVKVVENLKEKKEDQHKKKELKRENDLIEEMMLMRKLGVKV